MLSEPLESFLLSTHFPSYDFDLRASHARTLLPAALASVSFGFVLVQVRVRVPLESNVIVITAVVWMSAVVLENRKEYYHGKWRWPVRK